MRRTIASAPVFLLIAYLAFAQAPSYVGSMKCRICHRGAQSAEVYEIWQNSAHAQAYHTLASQAAIELYHELGNEGLPTDDPNCMRCHVTGYGEDPSRTRSIDMENGVGCESCHNAGGNYWRRNIMQNREMAIANGLHANPGKYMHCLS